MGVELPQSVALLGVTRGQMAAGGVYFAIQGSGTYSGLDDPAMGLYDLGDVRIANTAEQEVAIAVLGRALDIYSLSDSERNRLLEAFEAARLGKPFINHALVDELPLAEAARELGYGGLKVWGIDDPALPSSVFIWDLRAVRALSLAESARVRASFAIEQKIFMEEEKEDRSIIVNNVTIPVGMAQRFVFPSETIVVLNESGKAIVVSKVMNGEKLMEKYVVLSIEETGNAAFVDVGREQEIARILEEAAAKIEAQSSLDDGFSLRDLNGNRVGSVSVQGQAPDGQVPEGAARLVIETGGAAFDTENEGVDEVAAIFRKAAQNIRDGRHEFGLLDVNGNSVGKYEYQDYPSLSQDGVIDMKDALNAGRVYLAEGGFTGIAEGEYRFVVTSPDFEPGYGQDRGDVWLVNAKGEIADGYETPQEVRETMFEELRGEQKKDLREVVEGRMSAEEFERRYGEDDDLELN